MKGASQVKSEPKAFASLSSGLLARKGAARPAMRPQGFGGQVGGGLEDLGWNDMGFEPPKPASAPRDDSHDAFGEDVADHPHRDGHAGLTPLGSPVHEQQAEIVGRLAANTDDEAVEEFDETAEVFEPETETSFEIESAVGIETEAEIEVPVQLPVSFVPAVQPAPRRSTRARAAPGTKGKAAFTLRLDPERHLKLRLACAVTGRSAQLMVTDALDALLEGMPELEGMAEKAKRKG